MADSTQLDWNRLAPPALIVLALGWLVTVARPVLARLLYHLAEVEPGRSVDFIFKALAADGAKSRMKEYIDTMYAERIRAVNEAMEIAHANVDRLEALDASLKLQGVALDKVKSSVESVPRLSEAIENMTRSMQDVAAHMKVTNEFMARMDEREKVRAEERRWHDMPDSPKRRSTDPHHGE